MRHGQERGELRAGRAGGDFADGDRAVAAAEPLHVRQVRACAEGFKGLGAGAVDGGVVRARDVERQVHHPLDPRVLQHMQRCRQVAADGVEHRVTVDGDRVEAELVALHELFHIQRLLRRDGRRAQERVELLARLDLVRVLRAGAGLRLDHEREAAAGDELGHLGHAVAGTMARAGQIGGAQHIFHARFVAKVERRLDAHAGNAEAFADLGHGHLDGLEDCQENLTGLSGAALDGAHGLFQLGRVVAIRDAFVGRELARDLGRQPLGAVLTDDRQTHAMEAHGCPQKALRRL